MLIPVVRQESPAGGMPCVAVIMLGGTIASVRDAAGGTATPSLGSEELLSTVPAAQLAASLIFIPFRQCPSGDLTIRDIIDLAVLIDTTHHDVDAFVVLQGTDTLDETSFLLDLLVKTQRPVVLTGAMRVADAAGADGPANFVAAVRVAADPVARGIGPLVVFADEIHLPRFVRKSHTSRVAAFISPNAGPIGWIAEDRVRIPLVPRTRRAQFDATALPLTLPATGLVTLGLGASAVDIGSTDRWQALVIEGFGGGHVPGRLVESITAASTRIPVVIASRTGAGEIYQGTYGYRGSETDLLGRGIIGAGALPATKARLLLTLLVACGHDRASIADRFSDTSL